MLSSMLVSKTFEEGYHAMKEPKMMTWTTIITYVHVSNISVASMVGKASPRP